MNSTLLCAFAKALIPGYRVWTAPQLEYGFESASQNHAK